MLLLPLLAKVGWFYFVFPWAIWRQYAIKNPDSTSVSLNSPLGSDAIKSTPSIMVTLSFPIPPVRNDRADERKRKRKDKYIEYLQPLRLQLRTSVQPSPPPPFCLPFLLLPQTNGSILYCTKRKWHHYTNLYALSVAIHVLFQYMSWKLSPLNPSNDFCKGNLVNKKIINITSQRTPQ